MDRTASAGAITGRFERNRSEPLAGIYRLALVDLHEVPFPVQDIVIDRARREAVELWIMSGTAHFSDDGTYRYALTGKLVRLGIPVALIGTRLGIWRIRGADLIELTDVDGGVCHWASSGQVLTSTTQFSCPDIDGHDAWGRFHWVRAGGASR